MIEEILTKTQLEEFNEALQKANRAAQKYSDIEDGGAINFDSCVIKIKALKKLRELTDFKLRKVGAGSWRGYWYIDFPTSGQGHRLTKMAEAAAESLIAQGYNAKVYYQLD